jgi:GH43 family beta-xylosidase
MNDFTLAILNKGAADPWVLAANDGYYLLFTTGEDNVQVYYSQDLSNFNDAIGGVVWQGDGSQHGVWAPELHYINGR